MQGIRRRVVYVTLYELIAIGATSVGLAAFADSSAERAGVAAVVSSAVAVAWNVVFNTLFERWEARQSVRGRSLARRAAHAIGFEGGLVVTLVPFFAWWLDISLWQAFVLDL
ncbi:MAG TPA: PACE efflux transporter, partial [Anaerolineae bacterium]|nr:PACE efflux transporter [Anaerolineae bacterium]